MKTFLKYFWILFISFAIYILFTPLRGNFLRIGPLEGVYLSSICYLLIYFFLTLLLLHHYGRELKIWGIILLIILGALNFELIRLITHFNLTLGSLLEFQIRIYAILSGLLLYVVKNKRLKAIISIVLLSVGLWASFAGNKLWITYLDNNGYHNKIDKNLKVPDIMFENGGNETVNITDYIGYFVVLYFWDSSYDKQLGEFSILEEFFEDYLNNPELKIIPVFCRQNDKGETWATGVKIVQSHNGAFNIMSMDRNDSILSSLGINELPKALILNKENGKIFHGTIKESKKKCDLFFEYRKLKQ